jgi:hypothetical protein
MPVGKGAFGRDTRPALRGRRSLSILEGMKSLHALAMFLAATGNAFAVDSPLSRTTPKFKTIPPAAVIAPHVFTGVENKIEKLEVKTPYDDNRERRKVYLEAFSTGYINAMKGNVVRATPPKDDPERGAAAMGFNDGQDRAAMDGNVGVAMPKLLKPTH